MNINTIIGIVIGIVAFAWVIRRYFKKRQIRLNTDPSKINWSKVLNGAVQTSREVEQKTPLGATVFSLKGLSPQQLHLIDNGLSQAFNDARLSGWNQFMQHDLYTVLIPKADCVPTPDSKTPAFLVRADNFDGTNFDYLNPLGAGIRDGIGVIFAAEMVTNFGPVKGELVACPDVEVIENAVRFGAEHILAARNDPEYFLLTQNHDKILHPILPKVL